MPLRRAKTVLGINPNRLTFVKFPLQDVHAQGIENVFLDRPLQRTRAIDGIVTVAGDERFGSVG